MILVRSASRVAVFVPVGVAASAIATAAAVSAAVGHVVESGSGFSRDWCQRTDKGLKERGQKSAAARVSKMQMSD